MTMIAALASARAEAAAPWIAGAAVLGLAAALLGFRLGPGRRRWAALAFLLGGST